MEVHNNEKPITLRIAVDTQQLAWAYSYLSIPGRTAWVMLFQRAFPPSRCSMSSPTTSATNCRDCDRI